MQKIKNAEKKTEMHILKIIHGFPPEYNAGSEVYTQSIVTELAKKNKLTVFTREENDYEADFKFRKETKGVIDFVFVNMPRSAGVPNSSNNCQFWWNERICKTEP